MNSPMMNVIILHTHSLEDSRIKRHIQYLLDQDVRLFHIQVNLSDPALRSGVFSYLGGIAYRINHIGGQNTFFNLLLLYPYLFRDSFLKNILNGLNELNFIPGGPTIIHVHDPTLLVAAKKLCEHFSNGTKIVYDRHEVFEKMHNLFGFGFYQVFEIFSKTSVSGLVVVAKEHVSNAAKLFPNAITAIVPNYPAESDYDSSQILRKLQDCNSAKELHFVYVGSLRVDLDRDIDLLLDIAEKLLNRYSNIFFHVAGSCYDKVLQDRLLYLEKLYPKQFQYLGFVERDEAIKITQEAHFGFFLIRPNSHYWVKCSPNKVFEYLKCGTIPIIRADLEDLDLLGKAALIFSRDCSDDEIVERLAYVIENPVKMAELTRNGQQISRMFTWETIAVRYLDLYRKIIWNGGIDPD